MIVTPENRSSILCYVSSILPPPFLEHGESVITAAAPLLEWASEADGVRDLEFRRRAMFRAVSNLLEAARHADPASPAVQLSPDRLLSETRAYYAFMTGTAVPSPV